MWKAVNCYIISTNELRRRYDGCVEFKEAPFGWAVAKRGGMHRRCPALAQGRVHIINQWTRVTTIAGC